MTGIWKVYQELRELGRLDAEEPPSLNVVQSKCAPVVEAIKAGANKRTPWQCPESIGRGIEVPDPRASPCILEAVNESGGTGVTVIGDEALDGALTSAQKAGIEMCVESGTALAGAMKLVDEGALETDDEILIINTGAGIKAPDALGYGMH